MSKAEEIVQKQLDYYNNHDLKGFSSTYHEDIEILSLIDDRLIMKGKEALELRYEARFKDKIIHAALENRIVIGNKVIDHEFVTGLEVGVVKKAVAIYEVEDQLIKRVWFLYED